MNKLYKLTSNKLIQTWSIEVEGAKYRTHEGILDGAITTSEWTFVNGKNEGRANATSPEEQAQKEALAKWTKKRETYYEDLAHIHKPQFFTPMLAFDLEKYPQLDFPVFSSPKLDGMRCIATKEGLFSRNGKPVVSAPHIHKALRRLFEESSIDVLDGELYTHQFASDFNKIISLAKKTKPSKEDLEESAKHLQYWVFDYYSEDSPRHSRVDYLFYALNKFTDSSIIKVVGQETIENQEELDATYTDYLAMGYEGQMIASYEGAYENKRSKHLLKRKTFQDAEFQIVDILPGKGNLAETAAVAVLRGLGDEFEAGIIGDHAYARNLLKNKAKVIGRQGTVRFQNYTPEGVPRFGKLKVVRDYE